MIPSIQQIASTLNSFYSAHHSATSATLRENKANAIFVLTQSRSGRRVVHRGLIFEVLMPNGIMEFTEFLTAQVEKIHRKPQECG